MGCVGGRLGDLELEHPRREGELVGGGKEEEEGKKIRGGGNEYKLWPPWPLLCVDVLRLPF